MVDVVIVPQGAEFKAVQKALAKSTKSLPRVIKIPIGTKNIRQTLEQSNFWQAKPKTVLIMGLCGSLVTSYQIGQAVLYDTCQLGSSQELLHTSPVLNKLIQNRTTPVTVRGIIQNRIITSVKEKQLLKEKFSVEVVDMESYTYLQLLQQQNIQVSILRIIGDDLAFNLPNLGQTIDSEGKINPISMTITMFKNPIISSQFIKNSLRALVKLEMITKRIFN